MLTKKRRREPAVIERLFREPYRFEYFQAMRLLERWTQRHGPLRGARTSPAPGVLRDLLRFENSTSLVFPASQLQALDTEPANLDLDAAQLGDALRSGLLTKVRITPAFMGLLGGGGALPVHYTERVADHQSRHKDDGPRAFLDTFSNRSLTLFYEAWRKYRLEFSADGGKDDRFLGLLLGLAGLGNPTLRERCNAAERGGVRDTSLGYIAATLRQRPVSIVQVARALSDYFGEPIRAEQFIGSWYEVPLAQQTTLGSPQAVLGGGALVGGRIWQRDLRLRLVVGPLDRDGFDAFLPNGRAARALESLLTLFTGLTLEYDIELVLRAADVRPASLAETAAHRLGWDSYLVSGTQTEDRQDVCYALQLAT
jgi:type VI secretion system protein ImpH